MPGSRAFSWVLAALGAFALLLQMRLYLHVGTAAGLTPGQVAWRFFGYFTILTNLFVVAALVARASGGQGRISRLLRGTVVQTAAAAAIVIVLVVYHLLLRQLWQPQGWQWVADQLLHTAIPILYVLHWWLLVPKHTLVWRDVLACLAYPAVYAVYALARGAVDGWYPYPFIDVGVLGYPRVAVNACAILVAFVVVAASLVALGRWQSRRSRSAGPSR